MEFWKLSVEKLGGLFGRAVWFEVSIISSVITIAIGGGTVTWRGGWGWWVGGRCVGVTGWVWWWISRPSVRVVVVLVVIIIVVVHNDVSKKCKRI